MKSKVRIKISTDENGENLLDSLEECFVNNRFTVTSRDGGELPSYEGFCMYLEGESDVD